MQTYKIIFHPDARKEYLELPKYLADQVDNELTALKENPFRGVKLKRDLAGLRKLYFHSTVFIKQYFLVYRKFEILV